MFNDQRHHLIDPEALALMAAAGKASIAGELATMALPDLKAKMAPVLKQEHRGTLAKIAGGARIDGQEAFATDAPGAGSDCMEGCTGKVVLLHAGGVSYVMVTGPIFTSECWEAYYSKGVVMADLIRACDAAAGAGTARAILVIDSPGGNAMGMEEVVAAVRRLKAAKPLTSLCVGMMCSGAYMLGCLADAIYATRMGIIGSLGAVRGQALIDDTKALEEAGVRREIVQVPGNRKVVTPGPIDDALIEAEKTLLAEHAYYPFRDVIVEGRGGVGLTADVIDGLSGAMFAATQALEQGLIDGIVVPSQFVHSETLAARAGGEASLQRCRQGASIMAETNKPGNTLASLSVADILAARPDIMDEAKKTITAEVTANVRAELTKTAERPATAQELAQICGDDKAMAFELITAGATISAAKDAVITKLRKDATDAAQKAADLAKVAGKVNAQDKAVNGAATGADNDEFAAAKAFIRAEMGKGTSYPVALDKAYREVPGLREKHLKARVPALA